MANSPSSLLKIAIIGAGPGGCMLARLLLISSSSSSPSTLSITIFEAEESINIRSQGGTLDLHENSGSAAIKAAGLWDAFERKARYDGARVRILDKKGKQWLGISASRNKRRPEIDRAELRRILLDGLSKEGMVRSGKKLVRVSDDHNDDNDDNKGESRRTLHFADGSTERGFHLIVGADGAWSKTRSSFLDSETKPSYSGVTRAWTTIPDAESTASDVSRFVARGSVFTFSDGKGLSAQQIGDGSIQISAVRVQELDEKRETISLQEVRSWYEDWTPELLELLERCEGEMPMKPLYELPVGYKWTHRSGITLLGDAAHLMTPFAGEGVNLALQDAMDLSRAILDAVKNGGLDGRGLDGRISEYEDVMWKRSVKAMAMTNAMMKDMYFTPGAPGTSIEKWLLRRVAYELPSLVYPVLYPLIAAAIYGGYLLYRMFGKDIRKSKQV